MRRLLWICVFLGFLGQTTGVLAAVDACADQDACGGGDCPEKHCPPQCNDCLCGVTLAVEGPILLVCAPAYSFPKSERPPVPAFAPERPPFPDPREILRVPR